MEHKKELMAMQAMNMCKRRNYFTELWSVVRTLKSSVNWALAFSLRYEKCRSTDQQYFFWIIQKIKLLKNQFTAMVRPLVQIKMIYFYAFAN